MRITRSQGSSSQPSSSAARPAPITVSSGAGGLAATRFRQLRQRECERGLVEFRATVASSHTLKMINPLTMRFRPSARLQSGLLFLFGVGLTAGAGWVWLNSFGAGLQLLSYDLPFAVRVHAAAGDACLVTM